MQLYNSVGPNPRVVRMFMHEKGIELPVQEVDLRGGENRREPYISEVNPSGQCPALKLDDGSVLTEITVICEYLDEINRDGSLIGETPEERAVTRMWTRRIDLNIVEPMAAGFRYAEGIKMFQDRIHCIPQAADDFKAIAQEKLSWLNGLMDGNEFIAGNRLTLADVLLFCFLDFGMAVGQNLNPDLAWLNGWFERMKARPSAAA